jgi:non-canonical poly(A) RNA polymerase PAPD5/7
LQTELFGSVSTGLFLPFSDIDIVVFGAPSGTALLSTMHGLANEIKARNLGEKVQIISHAKVIDCQKSCSIHLSLGAHCEIS